MAVSSGTPLAKKLGIGQRRSVRFYEIGDATCRAIFEPIGATNAQMLTTVHTAWVYPSGTPQPSSTPQHVGTQVRHGRASSVVDQAKKTTAITITTIRASAVIPSAMGRFWFRMRTTE